MRITVEGTTFDFDENSADNVELMAIERVTGMTTSEWADNVGRGSMLGITALVWIMRRRAEPTLEFSDVHFRPASLKIENDDAGKEIVVSPTT